MLVRQEPPAASRDGARRRFIAHRQGRRVENHSQNTRDDLTLVQNALNCGTTTEQQLCGAAALASLSEVVEEESGSAGERAGERLRESRRGRDLGSDFLRLDV